MVALTTVGSAQGRIISARSSGTAVEFLVEQQRRQTRRSRTRSETEITVNLMVTSSADWKSGLPSALT